MEIAQGFLNDSQAGLGPVLNDGVLHVERAARARVSAALEAAETGSSRPRKGANHFGTSAESTTRAAGFRDAAGMPNVFPARSTNNKAEVTEKMMFSWWMVKWEDGRSVEWAENAPWLWKPSDKSFSELLAEPTGDALTVLEWRNIA